MPGKFDSKRDELLHQLTLEGWTSFETGSNEAPCGHIVRLTLTTEDLGEAYLQKVENTEGIKREDILGNFIVRENDQGFVTVESYDTPEASLAEFKRLDKGFLEWINNHPDYAPPF